MKLACLTMFRNEAAILGPFLDQLTALFDHVVLLDHGSTDGGADLVKDRGADQINLLRLQALGYPQSELATAMASRIFAQYQPDFLFFLDADEFLPFADHAELEAFLEFHRNADVIKLHWLPICPESLDEPNIFSGRFLRAASPSPYCKIVLNGRIAKRVGWRVCQGYHDIELLSGKPVKVVDVSEPVLLHLPIQSRTQFRFKVAAGARRIRRDPMLVSQGLGSHWIALERKAAQGQLDAEALRSLALCYPDFPEKMINGKPLEFTFPYVHSSYRETNASLSGQLDGLLQMIDAPPPNDARSFTVLDQRGDVVVSSGPEPSRLDGDLPLAVPNAPKSLFSGVLGDEYTALVEPLFNLPTKLPVTAWGGHIPFLFALFRSLRPQVYVELGVHYGASLIAAATAARTYSIDTHCVGVDSWGGDEHAGRYDGDAIYHDLQNYTDGLFPNVTLKRCLFQEARRSFRPGSISILHIDGLHTYDAVKEDFTTWFDLMAPDGVVLFHDICVLERGFGVYRFWDELKTHFPTMEFHHSFGLGVLFLGPEGERFEPFRRLMQEPSALRTYQSLAAGMGGIIYERMGGLAAEGELARLRAQVDSQRVDQERERADRERERADRERERAELHGEVARLHTDIGAVYQSTSWRATAPLRGVRRLFGR